MISTGRKLPLDLRLTVVRDGAAREQTLGALLGRRTLISVYMKNRTPSCDRQNESLRAVVGELDRAGVGLLAISRDTPGSHLRYAVAHGISYPLVSDPEDRLARVADSLVQKSMYGRTFTGPARIALAVDPDGTVRGIVEKVDPPSHADQLRNLLKAW